MKYDYSIGNTKISIPPTLLFSTIGKLADVRKAVTMDAKKAGDLVYLLGETFRELGGSEWYALHGVIGNQVPRVDVKKAKALYMALSSAISDGLVASCHDCSDGGLGVALAEVAFAGGLGMTVDLARVPAAGMGRDDEILFSESQSRFVVTISPEEREAFEAAMEGCITGQIGIVTDAPVLAIDGLSGQRILSARIDELKEAWQKPLKF
jgi:phosphoribosylformylglycinamidine synthase